MVIVVVLQTVFGIRKYLEQDETGHWKMIKHLDEPPTSSLGAQRSHGISFLSDVRSHFNLVSCQPTPCSSHNTDTRLMLDYDWNKYIKTTHLPLPLCNCTGIASAVYDFTGN